MPDLNEVLVFTRVAQHKGFSRAAKALQMPVSTVSRKVSDLEARLGVNLLHRTTRKLNLTAAGEAYFRRCLELLEGLDEAEGILSGMQNQPEGKIRITVPLGMGGGSFADFIAGFLKSYPKLSLDLLVTNQFVDLIGENVDLAIRAGHLADSSLMARKLGDSRLRLVASPAFLRKHGNPSRPEELKSFECLLYRQRGEESFWELRKEKARAKVKVQGRLVATDLSALKELALRDMGIAHLPEMYCTKELQDGVFQEVLPGWVSPLTPVHAVYASRRLPARMELLLRALENWKTPVWSR